MALIIVLSVFNGFESLVVSLFSTFNPDIKIEIKEGKTFNINSFPSDSIKQIPGIICFTEVAEENALLENNGKQHIVTMKGVSTNYQEISKMDSMIIDGEFLLEKQQHDFAVVGAGVAYMLDIKINDFSDALSVFVPNRLKTPSLSFQNAFKQKSIFPSGVFSVQQDFDTKYIIVPIDFARDLLDYKNEVTSVELSLSASANTKELQGIVQSIVGDKYSVKNRFQQQELLYKIMKSEKWAIFLILTFILIIATFNVIGSLSMLIIDKKKDIAVLHSMGANNKTIKRIFMTEGVMISVLGGILGLTTGAVICWLQQQFGLIRLGPEAGTFVVEYYPVKMKIFDFIGVFFTVFIIGFIAAWFPVKQISRKYLHQRLA